MVPADHKLRSLVQAESCLQERRQGDQRKRDRLQQAMQTGQRIVIDLDFEDCMTDGERKSLSQQLMYCYSSNCNAAVPCHLVLASFSGKVAEQLARQVQFSTSSEGVQLLTVHIWAADSSPAPAAGLRL